MRKILVLPALLVLFAPLVTSAQIRRQKPPVSAEREVLQMMGEWIEALKRNDAEALDRIVADDFHIITADGRTRNKEQELAPSRSGQIKFEQLSTEDVQVFVSGETAIATGIATFRGTAHGQPFEGRERFFDVYQKRKGRWQVIASRSTPATKPAASTTQN